MPCKTCSVFKVQFLKIYSFPFTENVSAYEMFTILQVVGFIKEQFFSWNRLNLQHCEDAALN